MKAQTNAEKDRGLTAREQSIVTIAALTAEGDLNGLKKALNVGLDAGLGVSEINDVLVQMYAYAGFPRSLNGISTFMAVVEDRKTKGIKDVVGKSPKPINDRGDKYERGRKTLEKITGQPQRRPAPGFGEFSPAIDRFLKEHLFADIFDSGVLTYKQRELATISALASMDGVENQLAAHIRIGMNIDLSKKELTQVFDLVEKHIGKRQAETARATLATATGGKPDRQDKTQTNEDKMLFPLGDNAPAEYFTGTVFVQMLTPKTGGNNYSLASVTFEPGARSNWHTHPAGQSLIVISGTGRYQERGKPPRTIKSGETIVCDPNVEHWHGASLDSRMTHIAVTNDTGQGNVVWMKPVTDAEYHGSK